MWFLRLPDCRSCDVRMAASWNVKLCTMCLAEVEMLEELLAENLPESPTDCM